MLLLLTFDLSGTTVPARLRPYEEIPRHDPVPQCCRRCMYHTSSSVCCADHSMLELAQGYRGENRTSPRIRRCGKGSCSRFAEIAYNNAVNASTGMTPYFANLGFHPRVTYSARCPSAPAAQDWLSRMKEVYEKCKKNIERAHVQAKCGQEAISDTRLQNRRTKRRHFVRPERTPCKLRGVDSGTDRSRRH